jgi:hypothetical protein
MGTLTFEQILAPKIQTLENIFGRNQFKVKEGNENLFQLIQSAAISTNFRSGYFSV